MCMRTNIELDDKLIAEAQRLSGIKTRRGVVHEALALLIATKKRRPVAELFGKIKFAPGYDHKRLRSGR